MTTRFPSLLIAGCSLYVGLAWLTFSLSHPPQAVHPGDVLREYGQAEGMEEGDRGGFQRLRREGDAYDVEYGFRNFNQDELKISVRFPQANVDAAMEEFGFRGADLTALDDWYRKAQEGAIARGKAAFVTGRVTAPDAAALKAKLAEMSRRNEAVQAALDATLADLGGEYRQRRVKLYAAAGFHYKNATTVEVDMPMLARRNARRMAPASLAFSRIVDERQYGMEELVGAVAAMAQTAMRYESPASREGDKTIGGVLPPPKSFALGQGDCDTKTGVIASILLNWPNLKMVGLAIPDHYLMAVHRIPAKGESFVEHDGLPYVMIEAAGPAWLAPGSVGELTESYLKSGRSFEVQPF